MRLSVPAFLLTLVVFFVTSPVFANTITITCDPSSYVDCDMPLTTDDECRNFLYQYGVAKAINKQFCCTGAQGDMTFNYWNVSDPCGAISISGGTASVTIPGSDKATVCNLNTCYYARSLALATCELPLMSVYVSEE